MAKQIFLILLSGLICLSIRAQELQAYSFEQADSLLKISARPLAIFIHTEWCQYCQNMKQTSFKDENVIKLLNEKFYFISFDGETSSEIQFRGHVFPYQPQKKIHSLAAALSSVDGEVAFPSFIILNPQYEIIFEHPAFMNRKDLYKVLSKATRSDKLDE